ncbi:MAG: formate dehydrogenase accessory sulfurtransferase FdhD [Bacteroidota bacterium]
MSKEQSAVGILSRQVQKWSATGIGETSDQLIIEEALEIRVLYLQQQYQVAITMRTPGADYELALGFLYSEAIISSLEEVADWEQLEDQVILIKLHPHASFTPKSLQRNTFVSSSCGVCGKASLDQLQTHSQYLPWSAKTTFSPTTICKLPEQSRAAQHLFQQTGGNHSVSIFNPEGQLIYLAEDVGRHNAMDKAIGWALLNDQLPLSSAMILLSGRASFELVQKAMMVGLPLLAAIGAPSSAAVTLADETGMTLLGFLKADRANVYCHGERLQA